MWTLKKLTVILVIMASYSSYGAGGPVFDETKTITVKEQTYDCPECSKSFLRKSQLNRHKRTHTGDRPYVCSKCGYAFSQKSTLTDHMRTHTGERPYACSECSKAFSRKTALTLHIRTHTGERPYSCSECSKAFTEKGTLTKHMRIHTGGQPYACIDCDQKFSQQSNLATHLRRYKHGHVKGFEDPDALEEYLESMTVEKETLLAIGPDVFNETGAAEPAAKASAAAEDLE